MSFYAVEINVAQALLATTEVVVEANDANTAVDAAKAALLSVMSANYGMFQIQAEDIAISAPRQVNLDVEMGETPESLPYVYDCYRNLQINVPGVNYTLVSPEPDYDSIPDDNVFDVYEVPDEDEDGNFIVWEVAPVGARIIFNTPVGDPTPVSVAAARPRVGSSTSDGIPLAMNADFKSRPTAGLPRPYVTLPNGYTPLDAEIRVHAVPPYYLGGPACIELGVREYCGSTGLSQGAAKKAATCPAPTDWTSDLDDDEMDDEEWDEMDDEDYFDWDDDDTCF